MNCYKKGMTLVELSTSVTIMFFLSISFLWLLLTGKTMWQGSMTYTDAHQKLRLVFSKLAADFRSSNIYTITVSNGTMNKGFSILSAFDSQNKFITDQIYGVPVWQKYIIYCVKSNENSLFRKEKYGNFSSPMTQSQFAVECDGQGVNLAGPVSTFEITPNLINSSVLVNLGLQETSQHGSINQLNFQKTIVVNN